MKTSIQGFLNDERHINIELKQSTNEIGNTIAGYKLDEVQLSCRIKSTNDINELWAVLMFIKECGLPSFHDASAEFHIQSFYPRNIRSRDLKFTQVRHADKVLDGCRLDELEISVDIRDTANLNQLIKFIDSIKPCFKA